MKKAVALILAMAIMAGLAACSAPAAAATAPSAAISTPTTTATPTPTPVPTLKPLTKGQQWYFDCMAYKENGKKDIYAICQAMLAYKKGELDELIDSGEIKKADINWLKDRYRYYEEIYSTFADDFLDGSYGDRELNLRETLFAILRGENTDNLKIYYDFDGYNDTLRDCMDEGLSLISVFPDEASREKISKIINVFDNINGKDVSELQQLLNADDLSWTEWWYVLQYITPENAYEIQVIHNGKTVSYLDYMSSTDFIDSTLDIYLKIEENFNKITPLPSHENADFAKKYRNQK